MSSIGGMIHFIYILWIVGLSFHASAHAQPALSENSKKTENKKGDNKRFKENAQWELRLKDPHRGVELLQVKNPLFGVNYAGKTVPFDWSSPVKGKLFLGIMSNENLEVFYSEVKGTKFDLDTRNLAPGLYYWVLESEEDVLSAGKFFYKKP